MELPPEVCVLHVGLQGRLCRGAMRLPSVLHSLEMALVAAELRDHIGPPLSCFKVHPEVTSSYSAFFSCQEFFSISIGFFRVRLLFLSLPRLHQIVNGSMCSGIYEEFIFISNFPPQRLRIDKFENFISYRTGGCMQVQEALTSGACEGNYSYETMELLGDSVLNFVGGVHMYINFPSEPSIKLHTRRHDLVSNKSLYSCGLACGLPGYIFAELLNTKTWVPPGPALEDLPQKSSVSDRIFSIL